MRLIGKLIVLLVIGICAVLAVDGYLTIEREVEQYDEDVRHDAEVLGKMLDIAIGEVWTTEGEPRALELIEHANHATPQLQLRWVWADGRDDKHTPRDPDALAAALASGRPELGAGALDGVRMLYTYVPPEFDAERRGALEIGESRAPRDAYTARTTRRIALVLGATIAVCAALSLVLGVWVVGRPVHQLVNHARRIGKGDLTTRISVRQRDELGELAVEMNAMSDNLLAETEKRQRAVDSLRHADRLNTVGKLSSGVAHELGTPLNVVSQRAAMIERREVEGAEALDSARVIREQADRMARIIRQLLDFARPRTPRVHREDLAEVVRDTLLLLKPLASNKEIRFDLEVDDAAGPVVAEVDVELLRQALTNLIVNAVQASPQRSTVSVRVAPGAAHATIRVADSGPGIAAEHLPHIFEPFYTTKAVGAGTGLGLSVTYGIVREHHGRIEVESDESGARFTVYLPNHA